jgi:hypothetical protein
VCVHVGKQRQGCRLPRSRTAWRNTIATHHARHVFFGTSSVLCAYGSTQLAAAAARRKRHAMKDIHCGVHLVWVAGEMHGCTAGLALATRTSKNIATHHAHTLWQAHASCTWAPMQLQRDTRYAINGRSDARRGMTLFDGRCLRACLLCMASPTAHKASGQWPVAMHWPVALHWPPLPACIHAELHKHASV